MNLDIIWRGKETEGGADEAHISRHAEVAYSPWETGY